MTVRELFWRVAVGASLVAAAPHVASADAIVTETLDDGIAILDAAYDALLLPQLEDAVRILRAYAGDDPDGRAHHHLARALTAIAEYRANTGDAAESQRQLQAALDAAQAAVARKPDDATRETMLGQVYGELAAASGVVGKMRYGKLSAAAFARALTLDPQNAMAHVGVGIGKLETPPMFGGSVAEALQEFHTAQVLDPACDEAWVWEGVAQRRAGAIDDARRALTRAVEINPRSEHAKRELAALAEKL